MGYNFGEIISSYATGNVSSSSILLLILIQVVSWDINDRRDNFQLCHGECFFFCFFFDPLLQVVSWEETIDDRRYNFQLCHGEYFF